MINRGWPPGPALSGNDVSTATPSVTKPIHHVITTATLTTIDPPVPLSGFMGPLYLIASSVFSWTTSGNIAAAPGTTLIVNRAYAFIYNKVTGKWHPMGQDS
jgi:hypothetical protein